ncbi:MAG: transketolase [Clostridia bacterium]
MQLNERLKGIKVFAEEIRVETLKEFKSLGFGHVGGSMSIIDVLAVLYKDTMRFDPKNPKMRNRDFLVTSKGHAGPSVYATLALCGFFPIEELQTLNKPYTNLPSHTDRLKTAGVDMTTGSLGQGVSSATGIALGNKIDKLDSRTFVFVGDGELNEGQCWEAAQFAAHHKLDRLTVFVDNNKKQLDGTCDEIMTTFDLAKKYESFGFHTVRIDGHDHVAILEAIENANLETEKPSCIVLDTLKGKGCNFVEVADKNHSSTFNDAQIDDAIAHAEKVLAEARNA